MAPKKEDTPKDKPKGSTTVEMKKGAAVCDFAGPGPKYKLRTLVGYREHCVSRFRQPAYTFGRRQLSFDACDTPGPKYSPTDRRPSGFTFGYAAKSFDASRGPGPKYRVPDGSKGPAFSIRWRTDYRAADIMPPYYDIPSPISGPAYTIGLRATGGKCDGGPGPQSPYNPDVVKPKAPMYSIAYRQTGGSACDSPGPKYYPRTPRPTPIYSFGVKHSKCAPPYIVECDEQC